MFVWYDIGHRIECNCELKKNPKNIFCRLRYSGRHVSIELDNADKSGSLRSPDRRPESAAVADLKRWLLVALAVLVLLAGRYDWSAGRRQYSIEGYLASAWMLLLLLPVIFYTCEIFCGRAVARIFAGLVWLICALPYRWLGFAGSRFWSDRFVYSDWLKETNPPIPRIIWFPAAIHEEPVIPHEWLVFGLLLGCGLVGLILASRGRLTRRWFTDHPGAIVGVIAFLLIVLQSWLHLSLRSPYSYQMHFAEPKPVQKAWITYDSNGHPSVHIDEVPRPHGWWHLYLFPDYRGAVNYDYPQFRACEQVFQGVPPDQSTSVMRRMLTFYISSQFSCFFNPYYVFIFLNTSCWLAATLAGFAVVRRLIDLRTATVFALLIATGSGFIYYANQPLSYLAGYAAVMVLIYFFELLVIERGSAKPALLFALLYGLGLLVSDLLPMAILFPVYCAARKGLMKRTILSVCGGIGVYAVTLLFLTYVARVPNLTGNLALVGNSAGAANSFSLNRIYVLILEFLDRFSMDMFQGFLIVPILAAIVGMVFPRKGSRGLIVLAFILPAFITVGVLEFTGTHFEDWQYAALPRIAYIAYPAIYFLAAIGAVEGSAILFSRWPRFARAAPFLFLAAVFACNNLDVLGYPAIYYHFGAGLNSGFLPFRDPGS